MDKKIFEKHINKRVELVNDENYVKRGEITDVFDSSFAFLTSGKTIYLSFDRVKEIRPLGGDIIGKNIF